MYAPRERPPLLLVLACRPRGSPSLSVVSCLRLCIASFADQFGDISKEAAGAAKSGIEEAIRKTTGNADYQFGDVTKNLAKSFLGKVSEAAGAAKEKLEDAEDKKQ